MPNSVPDSMRTLMHRGLDIDRRFESIYELITTETEK